MSKLFQLKNWLTLDEAARHLSVVFGEEVNKADVLRLGLDYKLTLSVRLVNGAYAYALQRIDEGEIQYLDVPSLDGKRMVRIPEGGTTLLHSSGHYMQAKGDAIPLEDEPYDLTMMGGETDEVEHAYQRLTGGPDVAERLWPGVILQQGTTCFQLLEHFEKNPHFKKENLKKPWSHPDNFYPAGGFPDDAVLVVRTSEISRLQIMLSDEDDKARKLAEPLSQRAETTYLTIIGALLELVRNARPGRDSDAAVIRELIENYSDKPGISKTTLETKFADARRRLHST